MILGARIMVSRLLLVVGLLLSLMPSAVGGMAVAQDNELEALLAEALTTHRNNLEAWRSYSFRREVDRATDSGILNSRSSLMASFNSYKRRSVILSCAQVELKQLHRFGR